MLPIRLNMSSVRRALLVAFGLVCSPAATTGQELGIELWNGGIVPYRYCSDDPACDTALDLSGSEGLHTGEKWTLRQMMNKWETALNIASPATGGRQKYVRFQRCINNCSSPYVLVRRTTHTEDGNMCSYREGDVEKVGANPNGEPTVLHLETGQEARIMLHELGHCLGLWHEFNRRDADRWLIETPDEDGAEFADSFGTRATLLPVIGNYDYDSIMHYGSGNLFGAPDFEDALGHRIDKGDQGAVVSARDKSRVLQYYAQERYPLWGFFAPVNFPEPQNPDALPNPYLASGVKAVGAPAIAYQSYRSYDLFARGSDKRIYWKRYRWTGAVQAVWGWQSIGCCFRSDPSAVSRGLNRVDVFAIDTLGDLQRIKNIDDVWAAPLTIRGGHPAAGIQQRASGDYLGPGVASRGFDLLDVFVVDGNGLLAVTTWRDDTWGPWSTLGAGYTVSARPAAVALSSTQVRLAINEGNTHLYEPLVDFAQVSPSMALGDATATMASQTAPTLTSRDGDVYRYRVLIVNKQGRLSHRVGPDTWRDIGGIPRRGTGVSAVATGGFTFMALINGEDATGCLLSCSNETGSRVIQPGGLWLRIFY